MFVLIVCAGLCRSYDQGHPSAEDVVRGGLEDSHYHAPLLTLPKVLRFLYKTVRLSNQLSFFIDGLVASIIIIL